MDEQGQNNPKAQAMKAEATRWLVFFGVAAVLAVVMWLGWSLVNLRNPITSLSSLTSESTMSVGIAGDAPKNLDIRTEQGDEVEQALLGNVYETLVSRSDTNKLQPGIARSWQASDDGLTYTFTLQ
ncbi:MAG TPA: ABC transporter substrate-binding protein, partial [Bifidobacterium sp.]|nr:ABC transporter substrate-binding protein [Bifidobacterium sp.]